MQASEVTGFVCGRGVSPDQSNKRRLHIESMQPPLAGAPSSVKSIKKNRLCVIEHAQLYFVAVALFALTFIARL